LTSSDEDDQKNVPATQGTRFSSWPDLAKRWDINNSAEVVHFRALVLLLTSSVLLERVDEDIRNGRSPHCFGREDFEIFCKLYPNIVPKELQTVHKGVAAATSQGRASLEGRGTEQDQISGLRLLSDMVALTQKHPDPLLDLDDFK
jgi:hypothetical protein